MGNLVSWKSQKNLIYVQPDENNITEIKEKVEIISIGEYKVKDAWDAFLYLEDKKGQTLNLSIKKNNKIQQVKIKIPDDYPETKLGLQFTNSNKQNLISKTSFFNIFFL